MEQVQWKYLVFLVMGIISEIFISSKPGQLNTNIEFRNSVNLQIKVTPLQFSHLVVSNSLQPHESQHTRPSCPSPTLSLPKVMSIKSVMPSNYLILCHSLLLLPSVFPSIRVFSNESALHIRWPKYWSFSFSITPSNEYSELISFRID